MFLFNLGALPDKLNPVIKPLMESVKREKNEELQKMAVEGINMFAFRRKLLILKNTFCCWIKLFPLFLDTTAPVGYILSNVIESL